MVIIDVSGITVNELIAVNEKLARDSILPSDPNNFYLPEHKTLTIYQGRAEWKPQNQEWLMKNCTGLEAVELHHFLNWPGSEPPKFSINLWQLNDSDRGRVQEAIRKMGIGWFLHNGPFEPHVIIRRPWLVVGAAPFATSREDPAPGIKILSFDQLMGTKIPLPPATVKVPAAVRTITITGRFTYDSKDNRPLSKREQEYADKQAKLNTPVEEKQPLGIVCMEDYKFPYLR